MSAVQTTRCCDCSPGECQANSHYLQQLQDVIRFSIPKQGLAAFFTEPIQVTVSNINVSRISRTFCVAPSLYYFCCGKYINFRNFSAVTTFIGEFHNG